MSAAQTQPPENDGESLSDQLFQLNEYSVGEDTVQAEITGVERGDNAIIVEFERLTTGETGKELMDFPEPWTEQFKFVRLLNHCGYNSASPELLIGDTVPVSKPKKSSQWKIDLGAGKSRFEKHAEFYAGYARGVALVLSIIAAGAALWALTIAPELIFPIGMVGFVGGIHIVGWLLKTPEERS